jgi:hypothetical protein
MMLWTEKGALLHAKSLNTDKAWDVYNELVDTYFRKQQQIVKSDDEIIMLGYTKLMDKVNLLQNKNTALITENDLLSQKNLKWADRKVLEAIVKAYGASIRLPDINGFQEAWKEFKKEALYNYSINLNARISSHMESTKRKTKPKTMDMIHDDELSKCISTAVALCKSKKVDISEILKKYAA